MMDVVDFNKGDVVVFPMISTVRDGNLKVCISDEDGGGSDDSDSDDVGLMCYTHGDYIDVDDSLKEFMRTFLGVENYNRELFMDVEIQGRRLVGVDVMPSDKIKKNIDIRLVDLNDALRVIESDIGEADVIGGYVINRYKMFIVDDGIVERERVVEREIGNTKSIVRIEKLLMIFRGDENKISVSTEEGVDLDIEDVDTSRVFINSRCVPSERLVDKINDFLKEHLSIN